MVEWDAAYKAARTAQSEWTRRHEITLYYAWRYHYADAMLAERAK